MADVEQTTLPQPENTNELTFLQFLDGLNEAQLKCVLHPPDVPLQILAGPGSGKTKVNINFALERLPSDA